MSIEIERKWLVSRQPNALVSPGCDIIQGYVALDQNGTEVRVRKQGDVGTLTIKSGGTISRDEIEIRIDETTLNSLLLLAGGRLVRKTRYRIPFGSYLIEYDIFHESLAGLAIAEVEFVDFATAETFTAPDWFGQEVTTDRRYKNKTLAMNGLTSLLS